MWEGFFFRKSMRLLSSTPNSIWMCCLSQDVSFCRMVSWETWNVRSEVYEVLLKVCANKMLIPITSALPCVLTQVWLSSQPPFPLWLFSRTWPLPQKCSHPLKTEPGSHRRGRTDNYDSLRLITWRRGGRGCSLLFNRWCGKLSLTTVLVSSYTNMYSILQFNAVLQYSVLICRPWWNLQFYIKFNVLWRNNFTWR